MVCFAGVCLLWFGFAIWVLGGFLCLCFGLRDCGYVWFDCGVSLFVRVLGMICVFRLLGLFGSV